MELIKISENKTVSARELYEWLGYDKSNWAKWYKVNISESPFAINNEDYSVLVLGTNVNGTQNIDFALSIDFSKRLSMMSKTFKGEEARNYFIECEKSSKAITHIIPQSFSEALLLAANQAKQIEDQAKVIELQKPAVE